MAVLFLLRGCGLASPNPYLRMQLAQVEIEALSLARAVAATLVGLTALVAISSATLNPRYKTLTPNPGTPNLTTTIILLHSYGLILYPGLPLILKPSL